jgi:PAS domain S-box-containing protein
MEIKMKDDDFIVSKTDTKGKITYGNEIFIKMSGYSEKELLGAPHNILRHKDMPKIVFKLLWDRVKNKESINAYVKNLTKNGDYYWVFANVTASLDSNGAIVGYYSVRRKPSEKALRIIEGLYRELLAEEVNKGVDASYALLNSKLIESGKNYDEFVLSLQK